MEEKIYVNFEIPETIPEFLAKFFSCTHMNDRRTNVETFSDEACTTLQCSAGRFRSFDDVLILVNTYYPETSPKDLMHILLSLDLKTKAGRQLYLHMGDCSTIQRIRMLFYHERPTNVFMSSKLQSKYSWQELLAMLGITNNGELIAYTKKHIKQDNGSNREENKSESSSGGRS